VNAAESDCDGNHNDMAAALSMEEDNFSSLSPVSTGTGTAHGDKKFDWTVVQTKSPSVFAVVEVSDTLPLSSSSDVAELCTNPEVSTPVSSFVLTVRDPSEVVELSLDHETPSKKLEHGVETCEDVDRIASVLNLGDKVKDAKVNSENSLSHNDQVQPLIKESNICPSIDTGEAIAITTDSNKTSSAASINPSDSDKAFDSTLIDSDSSQASDTALITGDFNVASDTGALLVDSANEDITEHDVFSSPLGSSGSFGKISFRNELAASATSLEASPPNSTGY